MTTSYEIDGKQVSGGGSNNEGPVESTAVVPASYDDSLTELI